MAEVGEHRHGAGDDEAGYVADDKTPSPAACSRPVASPSAERGQPGDAATATALAVAVVQHPVDDDHRSRGRGGEHGPAVLVALDQRGADGNSTEPGRPHGAPRR